MRPVLDKKRRLHFCPMPSRAVSLILMWAVMTGGCARAKEGLSAEPERNVREPAVAGAFYPADASSLRSMVGAFLKKAEPQVPEKYRKRRPVALIVPHAGYIYSGQTAAYAYKLLERKKEPRRVVLLGPSHHVAMRGFVSPAPYTHYRTPLGEIPIDVEARDRLMKSSVCRSTEAAHRFEHCLEVQLPFLQVLWEKLPPIVPVVVGSLNEEECGAAAEAVRGILDEDSLLIVSSDFTHYGPRFRYTPFAETSEQELLGKIRELDMGAVRKIEAFDASGFMRYIRSTGATICGAVPIRLMLRICEAKGQFAGFRLHYTTSAESTGDYENTVSYVSFAVFEAPRAPQEQSYSDQEKTMLLELARRSIRHYFQEGTPLAVRPADYPEELRQKKGVFVTLKEKGRLRGCIGYVRAVRPLVQSVAEMAVEAAFEDPRFLPLAERELEELHIEISVLSALRPVRDPESIIVGRDGLMVVKGLRSGLLLPQVAVEQGWDRETFLENTCRKAGLPLDAWKDADIYRFTAVVFGESDSQ